MDNVISVLIVEDEELWVKNIEFALNEFGFSVAKTARNVGDALAALDTCEYDIVLMDIHLNGQKSGLELGKIVTSVHHKPLIFISMNQDYDLVKAAAVAGPSAYLSKPISGASLFIAIQNAISNFNANKVAAAGIENPNLSFFFVKHGDKYAKIDWKDVASFSAGNNYVSVYNAPDKKEYLIRGSLTKILTQVVPRHLQHLFVQVNRADIVNISFVHEVTSDTVTTPFNNFPISPSFAKELRNRLVIVS